VAGDVKARMVDGAVRLLATRGLQGTSFSEVLELTGAPRGSVYHHFPSGKDELVAAAVDRAGGNAIALVDSWAGSSPEQVTRNFLAVWREVLVRSHLTAGCSVLAVTVATDSPDLLTHTSAVFRAWRTHLAELLRQAGVADTAADRFAALLVASSEGAVVMSRAEQSLDPFELVAEQLIAQAAAFPAELN
jgi:TetR/AcrR family transcriptional repressor of lmrAB and yxaGH operons